MKSNLTFNDNKLKICVPIIGKTSQEIIDSVSELHQMDHDLIELRIDYYENVDDFNKVIELLQNIRKIHSKPVLFTFRTTPEGGMHEFSEELYFALNNMAIKSSCIDLIDIELFCTEKKEKIIASIKLAHANNVKVVLSNHDFNNTPPKTEIISRFVEMQNLNGDIAKIAVMPLSERDVLTLMDASLDMKNQYPKQPFITLSMGPLGVITRVTGGMLGSCITFASLKSSSAPGQLNITDTKYIIEKLNL